MFSTLRAALFASVALAATAATASAQSGPPGTCDCAVPAAPVVVAVPPELPTWGVGLRVGGLTLAPERDPDAKTEYAVGGLQVRYRLRPRWQLELSLDHATEKLEDGSEGDRHLQGVTLAALYHFRPYARWDWYVLAGLGANADGSPDLSDEMRRETQQGHVQIGVGVERRWGHFGLSAELRAVAMGPADDGDVKDTPTIQPAPGMVVPPVAEADDEGTSGGQLTLGAAYYF
ncbi:MAG TPA: outer membrane beta-barrel protein [Kofleriaceae bacterium]|nr:outer membrane beta-barrel protein [Kofleriaceae bacterium]